MILIYFKEILNILIVQLIINSGSGKPNKDEMGSLVDHIRQTHLFIIMTYSLSAEAD